MPPQIDALEVPLEALIRGPEKLGRRYRPSPSSSSRDILIAGFRNSKILAVALSQNAGIVDIITDAPEPPNTHEGNFAIGLFADGFSLVRTLPVGNIREGNFLTVVTNYQADGQLSANAMKASLEHTYFPAKDSTQKISRETLLKALVGESGTSIPLSWQITGKPAALFIESTKDEGRDADEPRLPDLNSVALILDGSGRSRRDIFRCLQERFESTEAVIEAFRREILFLTSPHLGSTAAA